MLAFLKCLTFLALRQYSFNIFAVASHFWKRVICASGSRHVMAI